MARQRCSGRRIAVPAGLVWLLPLVACIACGRGEPPTAAPPAPPEGWFREITREMDLDFRHDPGIDDSFYMPEIMGSGGALLDYDGDGDLDVYLVDSGPHDETMGRSAVTNRLLRQEDDGSLADVTAGSGLGDAGYGMGCAVGDVDNDGDPDVFVTNFGPDALYRNEGDGTFTNVTAAAGVAGRGWSTSAAFFDYDLDGFLDLWVARYVNYSPPKACRHTTGRIDYCGPDNFAGVPDTLFRNNGDGTFTDVSVEAGIDRAAGKGLGVHAVDFDLDGLEDVYVANDGVENHVWMNLGDGRFEERAMVLGAALNLRGKPEASMGVAVGDIEGDGDFDVFMTHLDRETNTLYVNVEGRWFEDRTDASGLGAASLPFNGFGTELVDFDRDGDLDLAAVNGRVRLGLEAVASGDSTYLEDFAEANLLFESDGRGRFRNVSDRCGPLCSQVEVSRALVPGDLDGDGDQDFLVTNCNGPARLFRNEFPTPGHWLEVRAVDPGLRRDAIGAWVEIETASGKQVRHVTRTAGYLSSRDPVVHFGLGSDPRVERLRIRWPGGAWEAFPGPDADRRVTLRRGEGEPS